ncbi:MAG TPA: fibronectin-binding domain-containing protein [Firmicutes bacterium]|nr:fibronectin-binding domain-containing protein [Bacillota bacterium]
MPFDAFSIAHLTKELNEHLRNGRIDKIYQPDKETVIIEVFHPFPRRELQLLISAHPQFYRAHLVTEKPENPLRPPAFCMLLRKYLQGGRIIRLEQPTWERIIRLQIEVYDPEAGLTTFSLVFEAMGPNSNLILVNGEGIIVDALRRLAETTQREREILPGKPYLPPATPGRYHPANLTRAEWERIFQFSSGEQAIGTVLAKEIFGLSRPLLEETMQRAGVTTTMAVAEATTDLLRRLYDEVIAWHRRIAKEPVCFLYLDPSGSPLDFFPYQPLHLPAERLEPIADVNSAIVATLHRRNQEAVYQQKRAELKSIIKKAFQKAAKKRARQQAELTSAADAETYRLYGELIAAHLHEIKRGQTELVAPNYYHPQAAEVTIPLDPVLSPVANSQLYYKKYNKAKKGLEKIRAQLERTEVELEYYASLESALENSLSFADLLEIEAEMTEAGLLKAKNQPKQQTNTPVKNRPSLFRAADGWEILVGRNNKQNDQLTMKTAAPHDLWLHTQKIPGSHVIIRTQGKPVPPDVLLAAANLAVYYSKARGSSKVPVDYTERRHLRKPTGAPPGFVVYNRYQTLIIEPDPEILARLGAIDPSVQ